MRHLIVVLKKWSVRNMYVISNHTYIVHTCMRRSRRTVKTLIDVGDSTNVASASWAAVDKNAARVDVL